MGPMINPEIDNTKKAWGDTTTAPYYTPTCPTCGRGSYGQPAYPWAPNPWYQWPPYYVPSYPYYNPNVVYCNQSAQTH